MPEAPQRRRTLTVAVGIVLAAATLILASPAASLAASWLEPWTLAPSTSAPIDVEPAVTMGPSGDVAEASWSEGGHIVAAVRPTGAAATLQEAVSPPTAESSLPSVAVNAAGAVAVAWVNDTADQYEVAIRPPGGTFAAPIAAGATGGALLQRPPSLAIDDAGDVLLGETREVSGGEVALYAWLPAGGVLSTDTLSAAADEAGTPVVALDGAGDAIVAWFDKDGGPRDIARAITRPAGGTFGAVQNLTDSAEYAFALTAAIGPGGQAAVAWQRGQVGPPYHIEASTSAGPADLLSVPQTISPAGSSNETPALAVGGDGEVIAAWQHFGASSTEEVAAAHAGGSFEAPVQAGPTGSFGDPEVAADAAGDAMIAWGTSTISTEGVEAVTRSANGALGTALTLSAPGEKIDYGIFGNIPAAAVGMDAAGDAVVGWEHAADHSVVARVYDATPPTLNANVPASAMVGQPVQLTATASDDFSGVASMGWSFGDGASAAGATATHTYASPGTYTVTVTATDAAGNATSLSRQLIVQRVPVVCALSATPGTCPCGGSCPPCAAAAASTTAPLCRAPRCTVPHLKGLTRKHAHSALQAAGCRLGKVSIPRRYRHARRLEVAKQSVRPGESLARGAPVAVTLKPAPRARGRRRRA